MRKYAVLSGLAGLCLVCMPAVAPEPSADGFLGEFVLSDEFQRIGSVVAVVSLLLLLLSFLLPSTKSRQRDADIAHMRATETIEANKRELRGWKRALDDEVITVDDISWMPADRLQRMIDAHYGPS